MQKVLVFSESTAAYNLYLDLLDNLLPVKALSIELVTEEDRISGWPANETIVVFIDIATTEAQHLLRRAAMTRYKRIRYLEPRQSLKRTV